MRKTSRYFLYLALFCLISLPGFKLAHFSKAQTTDPCPAPIEQPVPTPNSPAPAPTSAQVININELLVNPVGTDTESEFIELWNPETSPATLAGWTLVDGKAKVYALTDVTVPSAGFIALPYSQTRLTLTNSGGSLLLKDPSGTTRSSVTYDDEGAEGQSFARNASGSFTWTDEPTPHMQNRFPSDPEPVEEIVPDVDATPTPTEEIPNAEPTEVGATDCPCEEVTATLVAANENGPSEDFLRIGELRDLPDGTMVALRGIVSLATERIGKTIFALQEPDGSSGTYVRMYGTERPELHVGDSVVVRGKVARANGGMRITTGKDGIVPDGTSPGASAMTLALADLDDTLDGVTVAVGGTLVESGKGWMLLGDDTGKKELRAAFEESRTFTDIPQGSLIAVTGVLHYVAGEPELLADDETMRSTPPPTQGAASTTETAQTVTITSAATSPVVGGTLALTPILASLGVLGWKKWKGIPVGLS